MTKSLLLAASALTLISTGPASAQEGEHPCLDELCATVSIVGRDATAAQSTGLVHGTEAPRFGTWGFDMAGRDTSVAPGDDFNRFANGRFLDALEIPADRTRYGAFDMLAELSENRLRTLVEDLAQRTDLEAGSDEGKIQTLYDSFMDVDRVEQLDDQPIQPFLAAVRATTTHAEMSALMGSSFRGNGRALFGSFVNDDARNPEVYEAYLAQGGLGLPNRDYYLEARFADKLAAYRAYVEQMLTMVGWADPVAAADAVVAFETRLAQAHWTPTESRNRDRTYNPMTVAELEAAAPGIDWRTFLGAAGFGDHDRFIVAQNTAFAPMAQAFAEAPVSTLQAWQAFAIVDQAAPLLSQRFVDANYAFRLRELGGQPEQRSRERRGVAYTEGLMGQPLGRLYVERWFPPESRAQMQELVANLRRAMAARIQTLAWMSPETRAEALAKLELFNVKIGYPDQWRDYSGLDIQAGDLVGNQQRARAFEWNFRLGRLGGPVDNDEWGMTPQTVNAYYSSTKNEIVFPAAILQPPFFDPSADPAVNYGGIGGVIGHEIGHGFDDQGRKSDGTGALREWWTPEDETRFEAQTARLGAQYDSYEALPGFHVQGGLTMGENIGDLAGVTLALEAYHLSLDGQPAPVIDGTTGDQRIFYGWAQVWRAAMREARMQQMIATDPHSPTQFRVIGPLRNIDAWYEAFGVTPGNAYYLAPEDRVRLW
ncbi:MAG: peptidase M13 [Caulobacterales bacterium]|nr:peptidase M13 [Caulobacterales bacterium]